MKIAVYGGTGNIGSRIVAEAASRGHQVTALSRTEPAGPLPDGATWQAGDLSDLDAVATVARDHDAIVTANGPSRVPGEDPFAFGPLMAAALPAVGTTRVVVVGGASSLLDPDGRPFLETQDLSHLPEAVRREPAAGAQVLDFLRQAGPELDWTYLSPPFQIGPGERTGSYRTSDETPAGQSISYDDYAIAIVDELETPKHRRARFTVATA